MFELGFSKTFVVVNCSIADQLDLGHSGNGLEVGVENGGAGAFGFVVAVAVCLGLWIKGLQVERSEKVVLGNCTVCGRLP